MDEHLDHQSQRLIHAILSFIMKVSHAPTVNRELTPLLTKLLQFLGTSDIKVNQFCISSLWYIYWYIFRYLLIICNKIFEHFSNLLANNPRNKEFLIQNRIVSTLFMLLRAVENVRQQPNVNAEDLDRLYIIGDHALTILRFFAYWFGLIALTYLLVFIEHLWKCGRI